MRRELLHCAGWQWGRSSSSRCRRALNRNQFGRNESEIWVVCCCCCVCWWAEWKTSFFVLPNLAGECAVRDYWFCLGLGKKGTFFCVWANCTGNCCVLFRFHKGLSIMSLMLGMKMDTEKREYTNWYVSASQTLNNGVQFGSSIKQGWMVQLTWKEKERKKKITWKNNRNSKWNNRKQPQH